jgi:Ca-activated chloride channel family protein
MTLPLALLTEEEVQSCVTANEEAGFGCLATERGHLPLKAMNVDARIDGLLVQVDLRQTFGNTFREPVEATYIFPLPARAAVTRFRMEVAGRVIEGVLQERSKAREEYEKALLAGYRAAITEEERPNIFTIRVGNLMPGEEATIQLTLVGPLPFSDGEATFRFPLVVAPCYIPGTPLPGASVGAGTAADTDAVPDASRITPPVLLPGYANPVRLSLAVDVSATSLPIGNFRSSLHTVITEEEGQIRCLRLQPGERINRDFVLRFRVGDEAIRTSLRLKPDVDGRDGTFVLTLVPPDVSVAPQKPRDVVFILDRSGSMSGWKMVAARRALARMVDSLTDCDRFSVLAFDNAIETPREFEGVGLIAANDRSRFRAVEFLAKIEARGGTEMARPLDLGVRQLAGTERDRERILVLVTDGQVGNEDQIVRELAPRVQALRIFTLGIGRAINEGFLQRLAILGGGASEVVESEARLDEVMDKLHRRIGTPVLTGLRLEPAGLHIDPDTTIPDRLPDLFLGAPLYIMGRYHGAAAGGLVIQARTAAGQPWTETATATVSDNSAIPVVWARGRVRALEDRFVTGLGDRTNLEKCILDTSLRFGVLCRFTAFVAVDRSEVVNKGGKVHRIMQPVEAVSGWEMPNDLVGAIQFSIIPPTPEAIDSSGRGVLVEMSPSRQLRGAGSQSSGEVAPGPSAGKSGGVRRFVGGLFRFGHKKTTRIAKPGNQVSAPKLLDLSAYRRRAQELLERLENHLDQDRTLRLREFGILAGKLEALIEDLKSVHAGANEVQPLEKLLQELRGLLAKVRPEDAEVVSLWSSAEIVLRAFTGSSTDRRRSFWK